MRGREISGLTCIKPIVAAAALGILSPAVSWGGAGEAAICPGTGIPVYGNSGEGSYRCDLAKKLDDRGMDTSTETGKAILEAFKRSYATVLEISDIAKLTRSALDYLLDELPDTARLINYYEDTAYEISYLNEERSRFFATNNRNMSAIFERFETRFLPGTSSYLMFESGTAKILFWRFKGDAIIDFDLVDMNDDAGYVLKLHLFTDSKGYHAIFDSKLFEYLMISMVRRIIGDAVSAANRLANSDGEFASMPPAFVGKLRSH